MDELIKEHGEVIRAVFLAASCIVMAMLLVEAIMEIQINELGKLI